MQQRVDPTFYRSPGEAMAAPREQLAYVTNSLYGVWDDLSYPQGVGAWMAGQARHRPTRRRAKLTRPRRRP